ncbi:hypothetical protein [Halorubrum halophilum]|uniref:hypothetical protein n=1 Tax=Halorubrum halophilum TaxID=413816 RepID=UPI000678F026|nr:hypothetical protein [Halorubrum halophilum]
MTLPNEPSSENPISVKDEEFPASTFLMCARELYADLLLEYLDLVASQNASLQDINGRIDAEVLEQGTKIHEQLF